jgi:hypothetical protein
LQVLKPLRPRTHTPLQWDDKYTPFIRRSGFLPLATLIKTGLLKMDNAALTALVDQWRPETHSFHLPCGEMTITLEDVAMLFGLRVDGYAVTSHINPQDWRDIVEALVGVRPDEPQEGVKDRKTTGVNSSWLVQHFGHRLPPHANALQIQMHARAWWVDFFFKILVGIPYLVCGNQLSGKNGMPLQVMAG